MTGPVNLAATIAPKLAACYRSVPAEIVASSGHAFHCRSARSEERLRLAQDERIARTLRRLDDHGLVPHEPNVWRTEGDDLLIRFDGFGPYVEMGRNEARLAAIEVLRAPRIDPAGHSAIIDALRAAASTLPNVDADVSCSAPMAWRPACTSIDASIIPGLDWWSGIDGPMRDIDRRDVVRGILDPELARLLPRMTCVSEAPVTLDDRTGLLMRPISWSSRNHPRMDAMGIMRAFDTLAGTLASQDRAQPVGPMVA